MNDTAAEKLLEQSLKSRHDRNSKKGIYGYMWKTGLKIILIYLAVMIPALLIGNYLLDFNAIFDFITTRFQDWVSFNCLFYFRGNFLE